MLYECLRNRGSTYLPQRHRSSAALSAGCWLAQTLMTVRGCRVASHRKSHKTRAWIPHLSKNLLELEDASHKISWCTTAQTTTTTTLFTKRVKIQTTRCAASCFIYFIFRPGIAASRVNGSSAAQRLDERWSPGVWNINNRMKLLGPFINLHYHLFSRWWRCGCSSLWSTKRPKC